MRKLEPLTCFSFCLSTDAPYPLLVHKAGMVLLPYNTLP